MKKNKMSILLIIFLLTFLSIGNPVLSSYAPYDIIQTSEMTLSDMSGLAMLHTTEINDGDGLTITITNDDFKDHRNIELKIEVTGGIFVGIPQTEYYFQELKPGQDEILHIPIFGLGMGIFIDNPKIKIMLSSSILQGMNVTLTMRIMGRFCKVLSESYDYPHSYPGYTLFSPKASKFTFLMDNNGDIIHQWESKFIQGLPVYLDEKGNLIRGCSKLSNPIFIAGGVTGRVEIRDWNNKLQWEFDYSSDTVCLHHDIEPLPNGNILMIAWEYKTRKDAIDAGRNPNKLSNNELWPDHIIEVKPIGFSDYEIVWEWHVWDHLIQDFDPTKDNYGNVKDHPELIDINYGSDLKDWLHCNSIDYNPDLDQIMISVRYFDEIWVIDHSTTTKEAAGHTGGRYGKGGDILYRWGNPQTYQRGTAEDQLLFDQHDAQWIKPGCPGEGNILVFNNGVDRPQGSYSSVDEISPPVTDQGNYILEDDQAFGPNNMVWTYNEEPKYGFYAYQISGAQRLPNGNTLICDGPMGLFFEVTMEKYKVWKYGNSFPNPLANEVFKVVRYSLDYPGINEQ